ncbi:MAG: hypothetical protein MRJ65_14710 [Candidatus Brocadiaceae bacterium]|nr:hypothetical protein [Candidatus Brocadiaceae bacterium]
MTNRKAFDSKCLEEKIISFFFGINLAIGNYTQRSSVPSFPTDYYSYFVLVCFCGNGGSTITVEKRFAEARVYSGKLR